MAPTSSLIDRLNTLARNNNSLESLDPIDLSVNQIVRLTKSEIRSAPPFFKQWGYNLRTFLQSLQCIVNSWIAPNSNVQYLFVISEPTHLNQLLPVSKLLPQKDFIWITPKVKMYHKLRLLNQPVVFWSHYFFQCKSYNKKAWFNKKLNFSQEEWKILKNEVQKEWIRALRLAIPFSQYLKKYSPRYIFIGNDLTLEGRLATLIGKQQNVPTGMIQHGLLTRDKINAWHCVNHLYVYGKVYKKILKESGYTAGNIMVVGAPYLDNKSVTSGKEIDIRIRNKFNLSKSDKYILVALSGYGHGTSYEHYIKLIKTILTVESKLKDINFIYKLHRKDTPVNYKIIAREIGIGEPNLAEGNDQTLPSDIFEWFHGCHAMITGNSMVAIEAILCNIPVISIDLISEYQDTHFIEQKASINVHSEGELLFQLKEILLEKRTIQVNQDKFIADNFYQLDKLASNRILGFASRYLSKARAVK